MLRRCVRLRHAGSGDDLGVRRPPIGIVVARNADGGLARRHRNRSRNVIQVWGSDGIGDLFGNCADHGDRQNGDDGESYVQSGERCASSGTAPWAAERYLDSPLSGKPEEQVGLTAKETVTDEEPMEIKAR